MGKSCGVFVMFLKHEGTTEETFIGVVDSIESASRIIKEQETYLRIKCRGKDYYITLRVANVNPYILGDGKFVCHIDRDGNKVELYDIWLVNTENAYARKEDSLVKSGLSYSDAGDYIYFEHLDEPSPDRSDYWNYVKVPIGYKPAKHQRS